MNDPQAPDLVNPWYLPEVADAQLELVKQQLADDLARNPPPPFAAFRRAMDFMNHRVQDAAIQIYNDSGIQSMLPPDGLDDDAHAERVRAEMQTATDALELPFVKFTNQAGGGSMVSVDFSFLDVGCGVGHYGAIINHWGGVNYLGTDVAAAMVNRARAWRDERGTNKPHGRVEFMRSDFEDNPFSAFDIVFTSQTVDVTTDPIGNLRLLLAGARKYVILHRLRIPFGIPKSTPVFEETYLGLMSPNMLWNREEILEIAGEYGQVIYADEWDKLLTLIVEKK